MCKCVFFEKGRSSSYTMSGSRLLEGSADVFLLVCDLKIKTLEDVGTSIVEVHLMKTLVDFTNR